MSQAHFPLSRRVGILTSPALSEPRAPTLQRSIRSSTLWNSARGTATLANPECRDDVKPTRGNNSPWHHSTLVPARVVQPYPSPRG